MKMEKRTDILVLTDKLKIISFLYINKIMLSLKQIIDSLGVEFLRF